VDSVRRESRARAQQSPHECFETPPMQRDGKVLGVQSGPDRDEIPAGGNRSAGSFHASDALPLPAPLPEIASPARSWRAPTDSPSIHRIGCRTPAGARLVSPQHRWQPLDLAGGRLGWRCVRARRRSRSPDRPRDPLARRAERPSGLTGVDSNPVGRPPARVERKWEPHTAIRIRLRTLAILPPTIADFV